MSKDSKFTPPYDAIERLRRPKAQYTDSCRKTEGRLSGGMTGYQRPLDGYSTYAASRKAIPAWLVQ